MRLPVLAAIAASIPVSGAVDLEAMRAASPLVTLENPSLLERSAMLDEFAELLRGVERSCEDIDSPDGASTMLQNAWKMLRDKGVREGVLEFTISADTLSARLVSAASRPAYCAGAFAAYINARAGGFSPSASIGAIVRGVETPKRAAAPNPKPASPSKTPRSVEERLEHLRGEVHALKQIVSLGLVFSSEIGTETIGPQYSRDSMSLVVEQMGGYQEEYNEEQSRSEHFSLGSEELFKSIAKAVAPKDEE